MNRGARNTDPDTSHLAANQTPFLRAHDRRMVLIAHCNNPDGLTDFEVADIVDRQQTSAGKRRGELRDDGYIEDAGIRRPAPSGALAIVWRITQPGIEKAGAGYLHDLLIESFAAREELTAAIKHGVDDAENS